MKRMMGTVAILPQNLAAPLPLVTGDRPLQHMPWGSRNSSTLPPFPFPKCELASTKTRCQTSMHSTSAIRPTRPPYLALHAYEPARIEHDPPVSGEGSFQRLDSTGVTMRNTASHHLHALS